MKRIVILASGEGSLAQAIMDAVARGEIEAKVVAILSDKANARVISRAENANIPTVIIAMKSDRREWDDEVQSAMDALKPDLVVSAGFMRLLSADFVKRFKTINTHPALLPLFPGAHPVRDTLAAGATKTGATVHWVDAGLDSGEVISQSQVEIFPDDSEESLHERIKVAERSLIVSTIKNLLTTLENPDA